MVSLRSTALVVLCGLAAASCTGSGNSCRSTTCATGRLCDPTTGACLPDPNYVPVVRDAGTKDAGTKDAGIVVVAPQVCLSPPEASTDGGTTTVDLSQGLDELKGSCNSGTPDSRERVFKVTLTDRSDFNARVVPVKADAGVDTVLYLRSASCSLGAEQLCVDQELEQGELLRARGLDAGTYFLVVEGFGLEGSGPVRVTTWATPPIPSPANDTCAAPQVINLSSNSATFTVDTLTAENDEGASCGGASSGREAVYTFTLASTRTVIITSASADGGAEVDPVIYLRDRACGEDGGRELACADNYPLVPEQLTNSLPAGQYYLFVDSYTSASAGPTVVTVSVSP